MRLSAWLAVPVLVIAAVTMAVFRPADVQAACGGALSFSILQSIDDNRSDYELISSQTQVPWELLAGIHYRETNFSRSNPANGQGIFQFVNGDGGPYPPGPVSDANFRAQLRFMADKIQDDYVWRTNLNYPVRRLKKTNEDDFRIKDVLFSYNGRASVYAQQAASFGYSSTTEPYEGSPYVMNKFDCARNGMGIITQDFGGLDGIDTRYGAFTLYNELTGGDGSNGLFNFVTGDDFDSGYLLADALFHDTTRMSIQDIKDHLVEEVPLCDINGAQVSEYGGGTRAEFGTTSGFPPPYRCLKSYYENITTHENNLNGDPIPPGGKPAAWIIKDAADQNGINPQVLLAVLSATKNLPSDDWPWESQYNIAAGIVCSGTQTYCDENEYGFYNQVNLAAEKLADGTNPSTSSYTTGSQSIPFASGCSSSNVTIDNAATASIYNYFTYQPNQEALDTFYGSGDGCSSYGVRDFWASYMNWFGFDDVEALDKVTIVSDLTVDKASPQIGDTVTAAFSIKNTGESTVDIGRVGICARLNGGWFDFGLAGTGLEAGETKEISYQKTVTAAGDLSIYTCANNILLDGWVSSSFPQTRGYERTKDITVRSGPEVAIYNTKPDFSSDETGDTATVGFYLGSQPTNSVAVPFILSDTSQASLNGVTKVVVTTSSWDDPASNTVTITGLNDSDKDRNQLIELITTNPWSADTAYTVLDADDVEDELLVSRDDESRGNTFLLKEGNSTNVRTMAGSASGLASSSEETDLFWWGHNAVKAGGTGDFDGDGLVDSVYFYKRGDGKTKVYVAKGTAGGGFANPSLVLTLGWWNWSSFTIGGVGDFNGDGLDDVKILYRTGNGGVNDWLIKGHATNTLSGPQLSAGLSWWNYDAVKTAGTGDFNADGFEDLAIFHARGNGTSNVWVLTGSASGAAGTALEQELLQQWSDTLPIGGGDVNGDGLDDLNYLIRKGNATSIWSIVGDENNGLESGFESFNLSWWGHNAVKPAGLGDVDGDGFEDAIMYYKLGNGSTRVYVAYGSVSGLDKPSLEVDEPDTLWQNILPIDDY